MTKTPAMLASRAHHAGRAIRRACGRELSLHRGHTSNVNERPSLSKNAGPPRCASTSSAASTSSTARSNRTTRNAFDAASTAVSSERPGSTR